MIAHDLSAAAVEIALQKGYQFKNPLGQGAFKSAYLVETEDGYCALKIAQNTGSLERLLREASALQNCSHSNIAKLIEAFPYQYGNLSLWVVREEYLAGGTLEEKLRNNTLPPSDVRHIGLCLADVLDHLNEKHLVHRDIKPANILFRDNLTTPVLTDFGVVRMLDEPSLTRAFLPMGPGTPAYAAPEQLNNDKAQIGWRTDLFGLAIVLSECLIGHHPYMQKGGNLHDAIALVAARGMPPRSSLDELTNLGFSSLWPAIQPWPVLRYRRPRDFITALNQS
ncbi:serine/threonine-protein kinase [Chromobacterium violaceum]|uniref:serine/threonine-protein kinase n=1 Tax=Chromobacterium violaceum TaxID=536 RepID=UPI00111C70A9|nr:serine/threonine-protein kinase [Chromobacterium violaceum]